jgi:hypothetical protein
MAGLHRLVTGRRGYGLGSSTEATRAVGRDDDVVAEEEP